MKRISSSIEKSIIFSLVAFSVTWLLSSCNKNEDMESPAAAIFSISGTVTKSDGGAAAGAAIMLVKADGSTAGQAPADTRRANTSSQAWRRERTSLLPL